MTIIVTGGAGFIGSNFIFHMLKKYDNYRIICLDKLTYPRAAMKVTQFLNQSIISLEEILSEHYGKEIRASIKIPIDDQRVKTYVRGKNNIISRGGAYRCSEMNGKEIEIESNYAYKAIIQRERPFFAEGNLLDMQNKFEENDVFFCEYGDDFMDIFYATIVMPIRIPVFHDLIPSQNEPIQDVLGILCLDCKSEIKEWSKHTLTEQRAYHIIANYADSLAMLMKEYRDASR